MVGDSCGGGGYGATGLSKVNAATRTAIYVLSPRNEEILASAAQAAGVEYRSGITVSGLETGEPATVLFDDGRATERVSARLVVGADGRGSGP